MRLSRWIPFEWSRTRTTASSIASVSRGVRAVPRSIVEMWHVDDGTKRRYETEWASGNDPSKEISARFVEKYDGKIFYTIKSHFKHAEIYNIGNFLFEFVSGEPAPGIHNFGYNWSAMIVWKQTTILADGCSKRRVGSWRGPGFECLRQQGLDTTTPAGR